MSSTDPAPHVEIATTFTWQCPFGCTVQVVDTVEQPHECVGVAVAAEAFPHSYGCTGHRQAGGRCVCAASRRRHAERIAEALKETVREQLFEAWKDGVLSGRRGPCYGVDDVATCRRCGCTDERACAGGCAWVAPDLCSACVGDGDFAASVTPVAVAALPVSPAEVAVDVVHLEHQREWSRATFGPGPRTAGVVDHIRKELREIEDDPGDLTEWVDVIILAFDGAWRTGAEPAEIIAAIKAKQARNEARTWPDWRTADPDRAIEHVRAALATPDGA